jgi:hypothetical protein
VTCDVCRAHAQVVSVSDSELQHALATLSKFGSLAVYFSVGGGVLRPQKLTVDLTVMRKWKFLFVGGWEYKRPISTATEFFNWCNCGTKASLCSVVV